MYEFSTSAGRGGGQGLAADSAQLKEDGEMSSVGGLLQARRLVVGQLA